MRHEGRRETDLRKDFLPHPQTKTRRKVQRRERERLSAAKRRMVQRSSQDKHFRCHSSGGGQYTASPSSEDNGAIRSSRSRPYGWSTKWSQYCTGELKRHPLRGEMGFPKAPRRGAVKISFNTSALPQTNRTASTTLLKPNALRSSKPGGRKPCAASGASRTTCFPRSTPQRRGGGCWFCHNQGVDQLRLLRRNYPEYWALMLKWDKDSPVSFKPDGHTVHDFDARFALEDEGIITPEDKWKWAYLADEPIQLKIR